MHRTAHTHSSAPPPRLGAARVAVVDPELPFAREVERVFRHHSWEVTVLADTSIADLAREGVDGVVLDVCPDGCARLDMVQVISDAAPNARVLALTAYPSLRLAVDAVKFGAHDCIAKPVDPVELFFAMAGPELAGPHEQSLRLPSLARIEWDYISRVLASVNGNISVAARTLGIQRSTLQRKPKKYPPRQ